MSRTQGPRDVGRRLAAIAAGRRRRLGLKHDDGTQGAG